MWRLIRPLMLLGLVAVYGQDSLNLVIEGDFDWSFEEPDPEHRQIAGFLTPYARPESNIAVDTCFMFGKGYFRYDSALSGTALFFPLSRIWRCGGVRCGTILLMCIPLRESLEAGRVYHVSFYVKASYSSYYLTKYVGLRFFQECREVEGWLFEAYDTSYVADVRADSVIGPERWVKVEGKYCARGRERYVIAGVWLPEDDRKLKMAFVRYQKKGIDPSLGFRTRLLRKKVLRRIAVRNRNYKRIGYGTRIRCRINEAVFRRFFRRDPPFKGWVDHKKVLLYFFDDLRVVPTGKSCSGNE